jgi:hypothetical protein
MIITHQSMTCPWLQSQDPDLGIGSPNEATGLRTQGKVHDGGVRLQKAIILAVAILLPDLASAGGGMLSLSHASGHFGNRIWLIGRGKRASHLARDRGEDAGSERIEGDVGVAIPWPISEEDRSIIWFAAWPSGSQALSPGPLVVEIEIGRDGKEDSKGKADIWPDFCFGIECLSSATTSNDPSFAH